MISYNPLITHFTSTLILPLTFPSHHWSSLVCSLYLSASFLFYCKKKEMLPFAVTGMHLEGIVLSEVSQIEKDKDCKMTSYNK